jgi:glucokinase
LNTDSYPRLLGDVGGTNARFGWQNKPGADLSHVGSWLCNEHDSLLDAIRHHLQVHALPTPRACGIGIANPITGDQVRMTNHHWSFSIADLQKSLGVARLVVINDFTALAVAADTRTPGPAPIGGGEAVAEATQALLGAGTGLGVSGPLPDATAQWVAITGEGGHVTLAAADEQEERVVAW